MLNQIFPAGENKEKIVIKLKVNKSGLSKFIVKSCILLPV